MTTALTVWSRETPFQKIQRALFREEHRLIEEVFKKLSMPRHLYRAMKAIAERPPQDE